MKFSSHRAINFSYQRLQLMANKCANKANSVLGLIRLFSVVKFSSHRAINFSYQRLQLMANKCANKANSVLGLIRRTVGPKNPELFSKLYKSLVCPILEYCSPGQFGVRTLKKTQTPWRKYNVEH